MMRRQRVPSTNFVSGGVLNNSSNVQTRNANAPSTPQQKQAAAPQTQAATPQAQAKQTTPVVAQKQTPAAVKKVAPQQEVQNVAAPVEQTPMAVDTNQQLQATETDSGLEESGVSKRPFRWLPSTKKPSVRAKERKIRQNRRLRKVLIPKNALMALHEVKGIIISDFAINNRPEGGFSAKVSVNNMQYEGIGSSKVSAKNNACEKALRDHIIFKMIQSTRKPKNTSIDAEESTSEEPDVEMKDNESETKGEEDDVPMLNLASFALFKLFQEWENEGFEIPEFRPTTGTSTNGATTPPPPAIKHELPANWENMHPSSLLCMMRPGLQYTYLGGEGQPPKTIQRVGVCVDGENFIGQGRSQKIARRDAAIQACNSIFKTNFARE